MVPSHVQTRERRRSLCRPDYGRRRWPHFGRDAAVEQRLRQLRRRLFDRCAWENMLPATENGRAVETTVLVPIVWKLTH